MRKTMILAAAVAAATTAASMVGAEEKRSFGCEHTSGVDEAELTARASNIGMRRVLQEYRVRWDAAHVRAQCEAFAAGKPYEISCLRGRRDWSEIEAMIPNDLKGLSAGDLRPHYLALQAENDGFRDAIKFCRSVGAITRGR